MAGSPVPVCEFCFGLDFWFGQNSCSWLSFLITVGTLAPAPAVMGAFALALPFEMVGTLVLALALPFEMVGTHAWTLTFSILGTLTLSLKYSKLKILTLILI